MKKQIKKELTHGDIKNLMRIKASKAGGRLYNNPVGTGVLLNQHTVAMLNLIPQAKAILNKCSGIITFGAGGRGAPDLVGHTVGGKLIWVEVKQPNQIPTKHQRLWHEGARTGGSMVEVCKGEDDIERVCKVISSN